MFGAAALVVGRNAFLYGDCRYQGCKSARVPLDDIADRAAYRYYAGSGGWRPRPSDGVFTIAPGAAGQTVFYSAGLRGWVNVFMPFATNTVKYQVGGSPWSPWSGSRTAGETRGGKANNYALFAHPEYTGRDGLTQYLSYFNPNTGAQHLLEWRLARE